MNEELNKNISSQGNTNIRSSTVQSKVTSIVQRRTREIGEDEFSNIEGGLQVFNSQSSKTQIGQVEGLINQQQHLYQDLGTLTGVNNIDMNFLQDINNECNFLITKFQQDQYVSQSRVNQQYDIKNSISDSERQMFQKQQRLGTAASQLQKDLRPKSEEKIMQQTKSSKTVGSMAQPSRTIIPPLNENHAFNHFQPDAISSDNLPSTHKFKNFQTSAKNSNVLSAKVQTLQYNKEPDRFKKQQILSDHEDTITNLQVDNNRKIEEDKSNKQVSSFQNEQSKFTISDQQSIKSIGTKPAFNQQKVREENQTQFKIDSQRDQTHNKLTFRQDNQNKVEYQLPQDHHQEDNNNFKNSSLIGNSLHAQFDLQNFNAFDGKIEGVSVDTSKDFPAFDMSSIFNNKPVLNKDDPIQIHNNNSFLKYQNNFNPSSIYTDEEQSQRHQQQILSERRYLQSQGDEQMNIQEQDETDKNEEENYEDDEDQEQDEDDGEQEDDDENNEQQHSDDDNNPRYPSQLNDDVIYNRLPKNFFVQEQEESKDLDNVLSSIKQMRQEFLGYINENNIQEKLDEISNIIQPEKFIQKALGRIGEDHEDPTELLFDKVISPKRLADDIEPQRSIMPLVNQNSSIYDDALKRGTVEDIEDRLKNTIVEEDVESSPDHTLKYQQIASQVTSQKQTPKNIKSGQKLRSQIESQRQLKQNMISKADNLFLPQKKHMKMSDYFKKDVPQNVEIQAKPEEDGIALNEEQKEQLKIQMEKDILANIEINFLFNTSDQLRYALINPKKAFKIMMKIKEVAAQHIENGIKEIDYEEIVKFIKEEEIYEEEKQEGRFEIEQVQSNSEPLKSKVLWKASDDDPEQWSQVVEFMRRNPKLLMQMLPDSKEDDSGDNQAQNKNRLQSQIEEAKKWAKLQALSKNFLNKKKDLLDAIDVHQQERVKMPSPPRNNQNKERKLIQFKNNKRLNNKVADKKQSSPNKDIKDQNQQFGSDSEYFPKENQKIAQSKPIGQKSFNFNSSSTAKNIYSNPPFIQTDVTQHQSALSALQIQNQINSNRPTAQSQQQQTRQIQNKSHLKGSVLSTMGDITTLGTTATGHMTNLNNYQMQQQQNYKLNGNGQHQTIEEQNSSNTPGGLSMFQNYAQQNNPVTSQRRPITASAAGQQKRSLSYMKPILQQRQESFDSNSVKASVFNRVQSVNKGQRMLNKEYFIDQNSMIDEISVNNYFSQGIDKQSYYNNNQSDVGLNRSFIGGNQTQQILPLNLGPSKKTQHFINKIAPNLKENEMYPKYAQRARKHNLLQSEYNSNSQKFVAPPQRHESASTVSNNVHIKLNQSKRLLLNNKRQDAMNQSYQSLGKGASQDNAYEQTPQGVFPKFVRLSSQMSSSRKQGSNHHSHAAIETQTQTKYKKFVDQNQQTRIGGVNNKLLISPHSAATNPFQNENASQISRQDSQYSDKFSRKHLKMPIVDWAFTPLFQKTLSNDLVFNKEQDLTLYLESEVDYVIEMMKNKFREFKRSDIIRPFYLKAFQTMKLLHNEQGLDSLFDKMSKKYEEITIENTMKLLIRSKLAFHSRFMIIEILQQLISYEMIAVELKSIIDQNTKYKVTQEEYENIQNSGKKLFDCGHQLLVKIKGLRSVHKQFKTPFIFKKKDYVNYVKSEMNEVKKLISIFKVLGKDEKLEDEQQPGDPKILNQIEENRNETEEQSLYSSEQTNNSQNQL